MAGPALDYTYRYAAPSALIPSAEGEQLFLATQVSPSAPPVFFRGALVEPRRTADLLLALMRVVQSRFHIPAQMLARIIALADPVVTCSEDRLRFEGFSACCSTYARVDLLPKAIEGTFLGHGTTNVDFNPPMRAALARVREREPVRLSVGGAAVELESGGGTVTERKVPLPVRWLKGFVESQAYLAGMTLRLEVSGTEARRFLRSLPRQGSQGRPVWVTRSGPGLRLTQVATKDAVRVSGIERLRLLEDLARHAVGLKVYASSDGEASDWELHCGDALFHLTLSPEVWRGFSGEGQILSTLAAGAGGEEVERMREALHWQSRLDPAQLSQRADVPPERTRAALARLAASGLVGFDVTQGAYFHRELPFDLSLIESLQPRLRDARKLVAENGVRIESQGEVTEAWVQGSGVEHRVRVTEEGARCTCPWYAKHQGERGPCKHVLAVQIVTGDADDH
ncbi:MAG: hypothetical protein K0Q72_753 [Armatimonadetes bacterium]|nr:hypothetical protein [Armatimonadota bacterium]